MYINEKYCNTLELDKILTELAKFTCCDYAKEKVMQIKPCTIANVVRDELEKTNDAFLLSAKFGTPSFANLKDPKDILKLAEAGGLMTLRSFLNIAEILRQVRLLTEWIRQGENVENRLTEIFGYLVPNKTLEKKINSVVISEDMIDDFASEELANIRRKITSTQSKAKQSIEKIVRSSKYQKALQDNIVTIRDGRFVVPVKAEYKNDIPGLVHDTSSSGATLFIEPMGVVDANNEIRVLQIKEKAEIERIMYELSAFCAEHSENINNNFEVIVMLNIYFAKSHLAAKMNAMMPHVSETGHIDLIKARHPLINPKDVVPIDVSLGDKYKTLVVTGPNTGGKTVTLKTVGLLTLMAMCGMLIPAKDGSTISIFKKILVDIGDEQSIEQSLSTFSSHMTNIVSILKEANPSTLVLVDELGSGTDPSEGAAIAISILEKLKQKQCVVAATTHYSELKIYAIETENVENACCEFDVKTLKPTYRLLIGVPGRSNAFAISRRLGLDEDILSNAESLISQQDKKLETVISNLEEARQDYESKYKEYNDKVFEYKHRNKIMEEERVSFEKQKEQIIEQARENARKIVESVKFDSQRLMDELEDIKKKKDSEAFAKLTEEARSRLKGQLDDLHGKANPVSKRSNAGYKLPRKLKKGDTVLVYDIDKNASVIELPDNNGNMLVQAGIMKLRTNVSNVRLIEQKNPYQPQKGKVTRAITKASKRVVKTEIDLRGQTVEEALMEVDFFIDKSIMANLGQVMLIHGKGTGALRKAIHAHLKGKKQIKSFRLGVFGEGEAGVTVVEL